MNTGAVSSTTVRCGVIVRRRSHCMARAAAAASGSAGRTGSGSDYYKVLSLEHKADVSADEVRRAYRRLALQYHPDVCPPSRKAESTELFVELRRAYETLSDPALRVQYDAELGMAGAGAGAPARPEDAFARDVWEAQLCVLRSRSERRQTATSRCSGRRF